MANLNLKNIEKSFDESNEMYGEKRIIEIISENAKLNPDNIVNKIYNNFLDFREICRFRMT